MHTVVHVSGLASSTASATASLKGTNRHPLPAVADTHGFSAHSSPMSSSPNPHLRYQTLMKGRRNTAPTL